MKKGYSLVELTIVVGLVSILAITISAVVLTTIVNSTRIKNEVRIRQVGDYVVGQISTLIRNSRKFTACTTGASSFTVLNQDNSATTISITGDNHIASNSSLLTPDDILASGFNISCLPDNTNATSDNTSIIKLQFKLDKTTGVGTGKAIENPSQTFATTVELRNN